MLLGWHRFENHTVLWWLVDVPVSSTMPEAS